MANRNILYASIFVEELVRSGLKHVCLAPGSRNTPLVLAFTERADRVKVYSHLDERSMAFFALGIALASDEPVALVCSSGTAGANFFPAIIEAHQSQVPLIVLTADRPHELRHSGANQTIDQIKLFGDYALWFVDAALPEANPPDVALRNLRTLAARAFAKANGLRKGVVHINLPFRKPLEPTEVEGDIVEIPEGAQARTDGKPFTNMHTQHGLYYWSAPDATQLRRLLESDEGVIVCGPRAWTQALGLRSNLLSIAAHTGFPVICDPLSGVRYVSEQDTQDPNYGGHLVSAYESFPMPSDFLQRKPEVVIRFGNVPTSKWLNGYLSSVQPKFNVQIEVSGEWSNDNHDLTHVLRIDRATLAHRLGELNARANPSGLSTLFQQAEALTWQTIDHEIKTGEYFDGGVVYDVVDFIPDGSTLFAGNSLPVRHLDQFGKPNGKHIYTYANRGASGIDGNISTALGTGAARPEKPLVAIVGDITFYHDMNGLLAVHRSGIPVTIVLLNNDGGGIFHRLPINQFDPTFTDYFVTSHGLDFSHAAKLYGLRHIVPAGRDEFRAAFSESVNSGESTIIEVRTDAKQDLARRKAIMQAVHDRLIELK